MKISYFSRQVLMFVNQIMIISFLIYANISGQDITISNSFHILLITLMIVDAVYISYKNVKSNETLISFSSLLILAAWQCLFSLVQNNEWIQNMNIFLLILTFYQAIAFSLLFLFQGSAYVYQKQVSYLLKITCGLAIVGKIIDNRLFAVLYVIQWLVGHFCIIFLIYVHWKRMKFVICSHNKEFIKSFLIVVVPFITYFYVFNKQPDYLGNIAWYLFLVLPFTSVHNIVFSNKVKEGYHLFLNKKNPIILYGMCIINLIVVGCVLDFTLMTYTILVHSIILWILLYTILVYQQIKTQGVHIDEASGMKHFYTYSLAQIKREGELRKSFSIYLHDEILQDIISVKNMLGKVDRPEVKKLVSSTLEQLNFSIRKQMQEYHPILLKSLTLKENIQNLLDTVKQTFASSSMEVILDCDDKVFLVEPYNVIIYRMIKELVTNGFKHSNGTEIRTSLIQNKGVIELIIIDDGKGIFDYSWKNDIKHKGLASIYEQVELLNGKMKITSNDARGAKIIITLPMKGDTSYESFIS